MPSYGDTADICGFKNRYERKKHMKKTHTVSKHLLLGTLLLCLILAFCACTVGGLADAQQRKVAELTVYSESDYRADEWAQLHEIYENAVTEIMALSDKNEVENYDTAAVNAKMAAVKTDAQLSEEEEAARPAPTIATTLKDGTTYKSNRLTIDVFAKNNADEKIASSVTLNGENVAVNWDDIEKTSFTLYLSEGKNTVVISASDGKKQTTQTYTVYFAEDAVTFTLSADCFTIGGGYIIAPMQIRLDTALLTKMAEHYGMTDAAAMKENLCGAYILDYYLWLNGYTIDYTGSLASGFYLATIFGFDFDGSGDSVPANLREAIEAQGGSIESSDPADGLGEFCFTFMSGWMYMVNGSLPNVGMSDYYPQEGDVLRLQFTLYGYGADIGNCAWGGDPMFEDVGQERDLLTDAMAKAAALGKENTAEYIAAFELIQQFGITADELNEAATALLAVCGA